MKRRKKAERKKYIIIIHMKLDSISLTYMRKKAMQIWNTKKINERMKMNNK